MARRFVTYNTEDQAAGLVNVDERGVMKPGGGDQWDAVIRLDEGIYSENHESVTLTGMTVKEIYQAMLDGKMPRVCVYDNSQYGVEYKGVSPVVNIIFQDTGSEPRLEFEFYSYRNFCYVQFKHSETFGEYACDLAYYMDDTWHTSFEYWAS